MRHMALPDSLVNRIDILCLVTECPVTVSLLPTLMVTLLIPMEGELIFSSLRFFWVTASFVFTKRCSSVSAVLDTFRALKCSLKF